MVFINPFQQQAQKAPRPLATKFVKREPRLTKPLELRKIPKPKRQMIRRQVRVAVARMDQVQATSTFSTRNIIAGSAASSTMSFSREVSTQTMNAALEPAMLSNLDLGGSRTVENKIDMGLEMLDVNSMDTGRYRAVVVQDPNDKQGLKGFIKFAHVMSASSVAQGTTGFSSLNVQDIDILRDVINEWTGLKADFVGSLTFDDERLMEVPIIIPQGGPNESEMENLARYLMAGGFVFGGIWTEALVKYGGLVQGRDFYTARLKEDHPVFSSYFDLKGGVPPGYGPGLGSGKQGVQSWNVVTGFFIKGRLAGIWSRQGLGWRNHGQSGDSTRPLQFAVNVVVYALTQEGSMTQRLMQMVN
jgi:hypothetical protein